MMFRPQGNIKHPLGGVKKIEPIQRLLHLCSITDSFYIRFYIRFNRPPPFFFLPPLPDPPPSRSNVASNFPLSAPSNRFEMTPSLNATKTG
mmetsp:Transcript_12050/g.22424  ORF Transcript_12050/g.22424 Transcript_12050/m.22424 type:complete len:91 (-) Transcript_12050:464-736(-)